MTNEEANITINYLKEMQEEYIEGEGYERHPLPEWYALVKAIEAIEQTRWIPVSERLPEFDVPVLVYQTYYKGNAITIGRYHSDEEQGGYKYWQWIMYDSWFSYGIEHFGIICPGSDFVEAWMPLPTPYEPQESEVKE